ncbi:LppU/SCO3897 family protein [Cellulomonas sp. ICMP 17802]|uniref:LppU/SCO3897 family protein n=1 Tax=Cellulomonas sp. ICMP 17802 TaxID=3239199 RepID=UPI00351ABFE3
MKFNPPPNWPSPPEGFTPEPGWTPDPSLPAPPPGWQLWVEDDVALAGETTEASHHYKQARTAFWVGIAFFLAGAVSTIVTSNSTTGVYWYGGMIVGVLSLVRAFTAYRSARKEGAPSLSGVAKTVAIVGLVLVVGSGATAAAAFFGQETLTETTGSCWHIDSDESAVLVSCDDPHEYKVVSEVDDIEKCPADAYLEGDGGTFLCLQED